MVNYFGDDYASVAVSPASERRQTGEKGRYGLFFLKTQHLMAAWLTTRRSWRRQSIARSSGVPTPLLTIDSGNILFEFCPKVAPPVYCDVQT